MRRLFSLLLSAALALSLAACGPPADPGSSSAGSASDMDSSSSAQQPFDIPFRLAIYPSYSLHPVLSGNRANLTLAPLLYEPLFQVDETFQAVPVLCQSHTASEDMLSWTFTLRDRVTFSDGTPLTGQAAADALNLARQPGSRYARRLSSVAAITAEENSITITLTRPNGNLPVLLDIPIALGDGDRPLGTGPYVLSGRDGDLTLTARSGWWQGTSLPAQELPLYPVEQADDLISSFDSGDIGLVDVDLMGTNALGYSGSYEAWDYATTDFLYLGFNTQSGLCRSAAVRQALARAIDRDSIVQVDYARHAAAATLPVHPDHPLYDASLAQVLAYDPEQAVAQLEGANALDRPLTFLVNSENSAKVSVAQRITYQLESAGMTVTLSKLPFEDYTAALAQGSFDLYLGEVVLTADFDLSQLLSSSGTLNYGRWQDGIQTDLLLSALRSAGAGGREVCARELFSYLTEQVPIAPICFKNGSVLTQWGRLSGLDPIRNNVFYHLEGWIIQ